MTPIPTVETARTDLQAGTSFKPEGRQVLPQDCVTFSPDMPRCVFTTEIIRKVFASDDFDNEIGNRAADSYHTYTHSCDYETRQSAEQEFLAIAGFGPDVVLEFENQVRRHYGLEER